MWSWSRRQDWVPAAPVAETPAASLPVSVPHPLSPQEVRVGREPRWQTGSQSDGARRWRCRWARRRLRARRSRHGDEHPGAWRGPQGLRAGGGTHAGHLPRGTGAPPGPRSSASLPPTRAPGVGRRGVREHAQGALCRSCALRPELLFPRSRDAALRRGRAGVPGPRPGAPLALQHRGSRRGSRRTAPLPPRAATGLSPPTPSFLATGVLAHSGHSRPLAPHLLDRPAKTTTPGKGRGRGPAPPASCRPPRGSRGRPPLLPRPPLGWAVRGVVGARVPEGPGWPPLPGRQVRRQSHGSGSETPAADAVTDGRTDASQSGRASGTSGGRPGRRGRPAGHGSDGDRAEGLPGGPRGWSRGPSRHPHCHQRDAGGCGSRGIAEASGHNTAGRWGRAGSGWAPAGAAPPSAWSPRRLPRAPRPAKHVRRGAASRAQVRGPGSSTRRARPPAGLVSLRPPAGSPPSPSAFPPALHKPLRGFSFPF